MKRSGLRLIASGIALVGSVSTTVLFIATFLGAYLNPSQSIRVDIGSVGEANLELGLIIFFTPFMVYFWIAELLDAATRYANDRYPLYVTIEDQ